MGETIVSFIMATLPLVLWISIFLGFTAFIIGTIIGFVKKDPRMIKWFALTFLYISSYNFFMAGFFTLGTIYLPRFSPFEMRLMVYLGISILLALAIVLLTLISAKKNRIIFRISNAFHILFVTGVSLLIIKVIFFQDFLDGPIAIYGP